MAARLRELALASYPDQILITPRAVTRWSATAEEPAFFLQDDAPAALLASLPPVDDPRVRYHTELPFGSDWRIERFSSSILSGGLQRSTTLELPRRVSFVSLSGTSATCCSAAGALRRRIPGQVGKYLVLRRRRRQVLRYDVVKANALDAASCRPPFLIERALILCSGSPPTYEAVHEADLSIRRHSEGYRRDCGGASSPGAPMSNPLAIFEDLRDTYFRYLDSPFDLRYPDLVAERRALLDADGRLYRRPLIEPVPAYQLSGETFSQAAQASSGRSGRSPSSRT